MELNKDKLPIIKNALKENELDAWCVLGRETIMKSEPILPVLGDMDFIIATGLIFTPDKIIAIVSTLDEEGYKLIDGIDEIITYTGDLMVPVAKKIKELNPKKLGLNFSKNDASADGLTYGMKLKLERQLKEVGFEGELVSAVNLIAKVRGQKTAEQIKKIKHTAEVALKYLESVPTMLKDGTTSLDIFNYLHEVAYNDGYGMSWTPSQCPGVSVDPNVPAGHMGIIETPIVRGYVINIDYGVSKDGYCSDLQRMYYILKDDEDDAPEEVKRAFYTVRDAIKMAKDAMKPGVTGYQIDKIARSHVVSEGYDSWNAALGHQVGHETHDGGYILANRRPRYNRPELIDQPLDEGNVFTIEPGVETSRGRIGIEEMVVITKDGCEWLVPPQQELMLVRVK
ncbi:MAG: M24 family metallopeptidase [Anaerorhabdus sp.]|uniref:M24 family metallopeptidase n=1 Tax=Anaerorhabdus sp. TaxID=1872524 RepID=UPI003A8A1F09